MKIIITGASGFVGSHLCERLVKLGHNVVGIAGKNRRDSRYLEKSKNFRLIKCDITNTKKIYKVFSGNRDAKAVFHLAALRSGDESSPMEWLKTNTEGTASVLYAANKCGIKSIIYASTMNVYGKVRYLPVNEKHPAEPKNFYGISKLHGESYCRLFHDKYNMSVVILRLGGVYGLGRNTGAFAVFSDKAIKNEDIGVDSGKLDTWEAVYIDDIVAAFLLSNEWIMKNKSPVFGIFNIGGKSPVVMQKLIGNIVKLTKSTSRVKFKKNRKSLNFIFDLRKAKKVLGCSPRSLKENLKSYINAKLKYESDYKIRRLK